MTLGNYWQHEQAGDRHVAEGDFNKAQVAYAQALELRPDAIWITRKLAKLEPGPADLSRLNLFLPYYTPKDPERAEELQRCLDKNIESGLFARIILLVDDDTVPHRRHKALQVIRLPHRPSYLDWITAASRLCPGQIAILANSDIHFDVSIARLCTLFGSDSRAFVALTRFDKQGDALVPHPNPHWSQDTWAFIPAVETPARLAHRANVPLGVPRCDNRIAYVFATEGYTVYNPFPLVRSVHLHETGLRYYSKTGDRTLIGGMAMVHPGLPAEEPARLEVELWSEKSAQITGYKVNRTLERWAKEERSQAAQPDLAGA